jgi:predicted nucleotidyltransferase
VELLRRSVGIEEQLRTALLDCPGVRAAVIYGSWAAGNRRPSSDIDVLVIGEADLGLLRRRMRPVGKEAGRTIDLTLLSVPELQSLIAEKSSFARRLRENPVIPLVGSLDSIFA